MHTANTNKQTVSQPYSYLKRRERSKGKGVYIILSLILISAFGPYIFRNSGVRLEHLIIYPLAVILLIRYFLNPKKATPRIYHIILTLWLLLIFWLILITYFTKETFSFFIIAEMENMIQPLALLFILGELLKELSFDEQIKFLKVAAWVIIILLALNAILSIATIFVDTWSIVHWFLRGDNFLETVWGRSLTNGRYLGIFNQPFEAGLAYSIGLLLWVYLLLRQKAGSFLLLNVGILLIAGGLLSISKVFLLGGIPAAILFAVWVLNTRRAKRLGGVFILLVIVTGLLSNFQRWVGAQYLMRLFDYKQVSKVGALSLYSGGRLNQSSFVGHLFRLVWDVSPLVGFGFGVNFALDNAYLEFFYQGGLIALAIYLGILTILGLSFFRKLASGLIEAKMALLLVALVLFAGFGAPVLTINRSSILVWVVLMTSMFLLWSAKPSKTMTPADKTAGAVGI